MGGEELVLTAEVWLSALGKILREASDGLKKIPGRYQNAYRSMKILVKTLVNPYEYSIGEILVKNNIAYMELVKRGYIIKPQIPPIRKGTENSCREESMLDIDIEKLITKDTQLIITP